MLRAYIHAMFASSGGVALNAKFAEFNAPLKHSIVPMVGTLDSFARASTATVSDFEGLIKNCLEDEARFDGARRVENLYHSMDTANSWDFTVLDIFADIDFGEDDGEGGTNAARIYNVNTSVADVATLTQAVAVTSNDYNIRVDVKINVALADVDAIKLNLGVTAGNAVVVADASTNNNVGVWQTLSLPTAITATAVAAGLQLSFGVAKTFDVTFRFIQIEDTTEQSNNKCSEFVSVDSISTPYHGSNVDGVKYFPYENGNTVTDNVVTELQGAAIDPDTMGYLSEEGRTNYFLNSGSPATQAAMVTGGAVSHTVTVTGDYTVTADGSANITSAATYTWTPGATANIVIVSGSSGTVQIEAGSTPTSYIPTAGSAVARVADALLYDYQPPALLGSMVATVNNTYHVVTAANKYMVSTNVGARFLYHNADGSVNSNDGSTDVTHLGVQVGIQSNVFGSTWEDGAATERAVYLSGVQIATGVMDVNGFVTGTDPLGVGCLGSTGASQHSGKYSNIKFYNTALTQVQMEALTS